MDLESVERTAAAIVKELKLPATDLPGILGPMKTWIEALAALEELPLDGVEPACVYEVEP